jgi:hypothetical protein
MSAADDARRAGLLVKHAPTLAYHKHEPYWASSPAVMTDCVVEGRYATYLQTKNGSLIAQAGPSLVRPQLDLAFLNGETYGDDVAQKPAFDDYLNAHGGTYVEDAARMQARPGYGDVVYGRYVEGQDDRVWLQYWLFYYFNDKSLAGIGLHEGDWEMVQVAIDHGMPSAATYAQHDGAEKRDDWEQVRKAEGSDGASPLTYVALGSHASYFDPGEYRIRVFPTLDHARAPAAACARTSSRCPAANAGSSGPAAGGGWASATRRAARPDATRDPMAPPGQGAREGARQAAPARADLLRPPGRGARAGPLHHRPARRGACPHRLRPARGARGARAPGAPSAVGRVRRPAPCAVDALVPRRGGARHSPPPEPDRRGRVRRPRHSADGRRRRERHRHG